MAILKNLLISILDAMGDYKSSDEQEIDYDFPSELAGLDRATVDAIRNEEIESLHD